ncbi:MAG: hypothetical protein K8W52_43930 [Deltaproteobacteria bacterium]|nr:hypothetical protein [Deltaproteobacteria bacterium]
MLARATALLALAATAACVDPADDLATDDITAPDGDDTGKADAATELKVRVGDTSVWVSSVLARKPYNNGQAWVLHARASRTITDANAYIFDDVFGEVNLASPRTFDVAFGTTSSGPMLDGVNQFLSMGFVASAGRPDHLTARVIVRPRIVDSAGSSKIAFTAEVTPVVYDGHTVWRVLARTTVAATAVTATVGGAPAAVHPIDATHVAIDLERDQLIAVAGVSTADVAVTATIGTAAVTRRGHVAMTIKKLGLTAADPYDTWPSATCTDATRACLRGLGETLDVGACGDALTVRACSGEIGARVDGATLAATNDATDARLADPAGFASDATGLVGADHAASFTDAVRARTHAAAQTLGGRWYLSATVRGARLAAAVDGALDAAYARPLALVPAHAPVPGDAAATRQVVADAVLAYVATQDYLHSEFGRSLDDLAREFRAQHVASLRAFRETEDIFVDPAHPDRPIYLGAWLGAHTEVTIDQPTGAAVNVLVELD